MKTIRAAGNTVVPAILALEALGFTVRIDHADDGARCRATRGGEVYSAADPVEVLGLVRLVEVRGWNWSATDDDLEAVRRRHALFDD